MYNKVQFPCVELSCNDLTSESMSVRSCRYCFMQLSVLFINTYIFWNTVCVLLLIYQADWCAVLSSSRQTTFSDKNVEWLVLVNFVRRQIIACIPAVESCKYSCCRELQVFLVQRVALLLHSDAGIPARECCRYSCCVANISVIVGKYIFRV